MLNVYIHLNVYIYICFFIFTVTVCSGDIEVEGYTNLTKQHCRNGLGNRWE